ncbi:hypothetical protein IWX90DRAFT_13929 [Phyllosticta citrichinensis]|uniref:Uncharacterized protein n=1 Tax=Phyllosticta citrichinensis TaxID=1130410 RepID=A0ABR1Y6C3_9PEZI
MRMLCGNSEFTSSRTLNRAVLHDTLWAARSRRTATSCFVRTPTYCPVSSMYSNANSAVAAAARRTACGFPLTHVSPSSWPCSRRHSRCSSSRSYVTGGHPARVAAIQDHSDVVSLFRGSGEQMRDLYVHDSVEIVACALKIAGGKVLILAPNVQANFIVCGVATAGRLHQAAVSQKVYDNRWHIRVVSPLSALKSRDNGFRRG